MSGETTTEDTVCTLLLFGPAQTYCDDTASLILPAPTDLRTIFNEVERRFPGFGEKVLKVSQVVVNLDYVEWQWEGDEVGVYVEVADEVGVVPPVSAG